MKDVTPVYYWGRKEILVTLQELANVCLLPFSQSLGHNTGVLLATIFDHPLHLAKYDSLILTMTQDATHGLLFGVEDGIFKLVGNAVDAAALLGQQGELPDFKVLRGGYARYAAQSVPYGLCPCSVEMKPVGHAPDQMRQTVNVVVGE
ncbi:hypothetical protein [Sodalis sp. (in: enterobacteria)]|uniref:hypothetical protein n=1 Tax=Sodalis sp. (in: enterobacteria) TaxID=1898979 RepID=UPI003F39D9DE